MTFRPMTLILGLGLTATAACNAPSGQHSAAAAHHSGAASAQGSAAAVTGVSTVAAVPLVSGGAVLAVSGAALADTGVASVQAGSTLATFEPDTGMATPTQPTVQPDGPPTLN